MAHHRTQTTTGAPVQEVAALLASRPASWLRGFLVLSASTADHTAAARPELPLWFRLGQPTTVADGAAEATLVWWPHLEGQVFRRFRGVLRAEPVASGSLLVIEGESDGGDPAIGERALRTLVRLLAEAFSAGQARPG